MVQLSVMRGMQGPLWSALGIGTSVMAFACGDGDQARTDGGALDRGDSSMSSADGSRGATGSDDAWNDEGGSIDATTTADARTDAASDAGPSMGCFAFDPPSLSVLRASPHKVFAHYFAPFPISIDNVAADQDYYAKGYLAPGGESGKWQFCGGYLRDRPTPLAVSPSASWFDDDYDLEIQRAVDIGLDGFTFDILSTSGTMWDRLGLMLAAAERTDPGFRIALMPDMYATFQGDDATASTSFVDAMASVITAHPASVFRLDDGRVVIAPYGAEKRDAAWWKGALQALTAQGIETAFVPLFSNVPWAAAATTMAATAPLYGVASWGVRTPSGAPSLQTAAQTAHGDHLVWMAPVAPQDMRPKDLVYREAQNSLSYRLEWSAAISGGADWVQLITWNDYSESTEVSPSDREGFAFADLAAYYTAWFKTGAEPTVVRDRLYYFYRPQATTATPDLTLQTGGAFQLDDDTPATDEIELVALLSQPGTLEIQLGTTVTSASAAAGLTALRAPLAEGKPTFRLVRNGAAVLSVDGATTISNAITYQDLLYRAGSSTRCGP
jgi:Glycosyl hydrolase family 71